MGRKGIDISQKTFGQLTALEPTEKRISDSVVWRCRCTCGNIVEIPHTRLVNEPRITCGCVKRKREDKTNQEFGNLKALFPTEKRAGSSVVWRCVCKCGNSIDVPANKLKDNPRLSCGCLGGKILQKKKKDLTNKVFGNLTAIEPTDKRIKRYVVWRCRCKCGKEVEVVSRKLNRGEVKDCGCQAK